MKRVALVAAGLCLLAASASSLYASTVIVTSPSGVLTNPGPTEVNDPFAFDQWLRRNVKNGGSVGITGTYPRSGNGSMWMSGPANAKADAEYYFNLNASYLLSNVTAFSYDWYRSSSSTAASHYHPALRLFVDGDGNLLTTSDRGYLVFERAYNPSVSPVPTDQWVTDNALGANLWATGGLPGAFNVYNRTLADWAGLLPNARVLGISAGIGSGWNGTFDGAVDNITIGFGSSVTTYNFELAAAAPIPEPVFFQMGALMGLSGLGLLRLRRRA
jgi:hypothetical protein